MENCLYNQILFSLTEINLSVNGSFVIIEYFPVGKYDLLRKKKLQKHDLLTSETKTNEKIYWKQTYKFIS